MNYEKKYVSPPENEDVQNILKSIQNKERAHKKEMIELKRKLNEIQENCIHEYLYDGDIGYETYFKCQICGKEIDA
jgi:predicted transcriptional regulator